MLIALSGGADSVALLLMAIERGEDVQAAAHCNFGLRGAESDRDEAFVRKLCGRLGVRLFVQHFATLEEAERAGDSIEMAARRLRYEWFAQLCREHGFDRVAVAHHQDDNAETLLLNLARGTGLRGLTGMEVDGVQVVRPLLHLTRKDILAYLARKGQDYVTDSTNTDTHYKRNLIRHELLPLLARLNPSIVRSLNDTARRLGEAEKVYEYGLAALRGKICHSYRADGLRIDFAALDDSPAPATLLHEWLLPFGFTARQCEEALHMRTGAYTEAGGHILTRSSDALLAAPRPVPLENTVLPRATEEEAAVALPLQRAKLLIRRQPFAGLDAIPRAAAQVALDADTLCGELRVRSVREGDRFVPFGMKGTQLVSDYLTARRRSRIDKLAALVVTDDKGIVWLAGERPAARCAVTASTKDIVTLTLTAL